MIVAGAGADSITLHLREDRRHIQDSDVTDLKHKLAVPMNLELAITDEMLGIAVDARPEFCCFVPEKREELTTEGGFDVLTNKARVSQACETMQSAGIRASIFIDPDHAQIQAAAECGASVIEIHTGHYANAVDKLSRDMELARIKDATIRATALGMQVNAGHGLNYDNVLAVASVPDIHELNIGHAIVARAVLVGLGNAVNQMKAILKQART